MPQKTALIIGAGPAGLTCAYELLKKPGVKPVIFEMSDSLGGLARTVNHKGNLIDLGGHRFFSKSKQVVRFWKDILPLENEAGPAQTDLVMLIRPRLSRIYYLRKFFDYPLSLNLSTLNNLGWLRALKILASYFHSRILPIKNEKSLQDFLINHFGRELYSNFFRDYTQKVWGVPCHEIKAEWGAQRIKRLSVSGVLKHALLPMKRADQTQVETSLIGSFMYPKFGPGQLWQEVADRVRQRGGEIHLKQRVVGLKRDAQRITGVDVLDMANGRLRTFNCDYVVSTMPVKEMIAALQPAAPENVRAVAQGLLYRDFITVGLLLKKLKIRNTARPATNGLIPDTWIYIQEPGLNLSRLQIFNNWSPYLVKDPGTVWLGLEYMCREGDPLWRQSDEGTVCAAARELAAINFIDQSDVLDSVVIKTPKAYPAYFGTYDRFGEVRDFIDDIANLFCAGRNGLHRYNNQDHSMLTAMHVAENIGRGKKDNGNIWSVNADQDYHEIME